MNHYSEISKSFGFIYKNRTFAVSSRGVVIVFIAFVLFLLFIIFALYNTVKSANEIENLKQQLIVERTTNETLVKEIQKSNNDIKKVVEYLTKTKKRNTSFQTHISNPVQLYGILQEIRNNLLMIDGNINTKLNKVLSVINFIKLRNESVIQSLNNLNVTASLAIDSQPLHIKKASRSTNIIPHINITPIADKIIIKDKELHNILKMLQNIPTEKPIKNGRFISGFGMRFHPILHFKRPHNGIDFTAPRGSKIVATAEGRVEKSEYSHTYGNYVVIKHKNNIKTLYAHMESRLVQKGQKVKTKQPIGKIGSTGLSTGTHLHYEVTVDNKYINPMTLIKSKSILQDV